MAGQRGEPMRPTMMLRQFQTVTFRHFQVESYHSGIGVAVDHCVSQAKPVAGLNHMVGNNLPKQRKPKKADTETALKTILSGFWDEALISKIRSKTTDKLFWQGKGCSISKKNETFERRFIWLLGGWSWTILELLLNYGSNAERSSQPLDPARDPL